MSKNELTSVKISDMPRATLKDELRYVKRLGPITEERIVALIEERDALIESRKQALELLREALRELPTDPLFERIAAFLKEQNQ